MSSSIITINSRKIDGAIHKSWKAELLSETTELLTFVGKFEREINHSHLGIIRPKTLSYEYYWMNQWFNVFRFHEPEGGLRNYYCNINQPPSFINGVLDYVDLDIDVLVWKDYSYQILDLDEFEDNAIKFSYSEELRMDVDFALKRLITKIEKRSFPFDYRS
jgi:protein associated with RNAse G/E